MKEEARAGEHVSPRGSSVRVPWGQRTPPVMDGSVCVPCVALRFLPMAILITPFTFEKQRLLQFSL